MFKNKIILVTGGTGSWGNELVKQLLEKNPKEIRIYSRGEFAQVTMERRFNDKRLKFIIGDVRQFGPLHDACKGVSILFHLAALKHIPICEKYPYEAIKTNIEGTENVIKAAMYNGVQKVIDVSTDKACSPINFYGLTKSIGEKLIAHASTINSMTKFSIVRGGNVLGSNGSVVPHFIDQINRFNKITVTNEEMTRYFLTLPEAISLLFIAANFDDSGGIFVMKMPSCKIIELAKAIIAMKGNKDTKIEFMGIRQGEKLHEVLVSNYESPNTYEYGKDYYLIHNNELELPKVKFEEYSSNDLLMDQKQIKQLLERGGVSGQA